MKGSYLGTSFTNAEIIAYLKEINAAFTSLSDDKIFDYIADLLIQGKVIGWFNGAIWKSHSGW